MKPEINSDNTNQDDVPVGDRDRDLGTARAVFRDEIDGLRDVEARLGPSFNRAVEAILNCKGRLIISGTGKSGLIGQKIAATFTSTGTPSFYIHPVEAAHGDLGLVSRDDIVLFISKSGRRCPASVETSATRRSTRRSRCAKRWVDRDSVPSRELAAWRRAVTGTTPFSRPLHLESRSRPRPPRPALCEPADCCIRRPCGLRPCPACRLWCDTPHHRCRCGTRLHGLRDSR